MKQLEAHLARVRDEIAGAGSPKSLGDAAKQEGKGLLKIAQAGLGNTTGGLGECLHWHASTVLCACFSRAATTTAAVLAWSLKRVTECKQPADVNLAPISYL